jgi:GPH family glycoside/pentoside/hexuronide:cation symporter
VLAGMTNGAYQQIPWAMYPDLMDVTRDQSGVAIEGAFSAVWLFGQKLANAIAPAVLGVVLARAGWQEATGEIVTQTDGALNALQVSITLIPAAILLFAVIGLVGVYRPMAKRVLG